MSYGRLKAKEAELICGSDWSEHQDCAGMGAKSEKTSRAGQIITDYVPQQPESGHGLTSPVSKYKSTIQGAILKTKQAFFCLYFNRLQMDVENSSPFAGRPS